jgi:hypothetical protein
VEFTRLFARKCGNIQSSIDLVLIVGIIELLLVFELSFEYGSMS